MKQPSGMIVYRGPSMLDGSPIVMIAVGLKGSSNEKTGADLVQTYILLDAIHPVEGSRTGQDKGICGGCGHRGKYDGIGELALRIEGSRICYVNLGQGVSVVWKAYTRGHYATCPLENLSDLFADRLIRMGTYGDPAAVPEYVWRAMLARSAGRTGYSHQWQDPRFLWLQAYVMASVDTPQEAETAQAAGWRTFRVAPPIGWTREKTESLCPASAEGGKVTTCDHCLLCSGKEGKGLRNIMIPDHSTQGRAIKRRHGVTFPEPRKKTAAATRPAGLTFKRNGVAA
jgi:hypothetical protein